MNFMTPDLKTIREADDGSCRLSTAWCHNRKYKKVCISILNESYKISIGGKTNSSGFDLKNGDVDLFGPEDGTSFIAKHERLAKSNNF